LPWQEKFEAGTQANVCTATPMGSTDHSSEQLCPCFSAKLLKRPAQTDHIQKRQSFSPPVGVFVVLISRQMKKSKKYAKNTFLIQLFQHLRLFKDPFQRSPSVS